MIVYDNLTLQAAKCNAYFFQVEETNINITIPADLQTLISHHESSRSKSNKTTIFFVYILPILNIIHTIILNLKKK